MPSANSEDSAKLVAANDRWLTLAGLEAVLHGKRPAVSDVIADGELWGEERRVGLERDRATRSALEGQLYSARHIRVRGGVGIGVGVRGIPSAWQLAFDRHIPLGGESRTTLCQRWEQNISIAGSKAPLRARQIPRFVSAFTLSGSWARACSNLAMASSVLPWSM